MGRFSMLLMLGCWQAAHAASAVAPPSAFYLVELRNNKAALVHSLSKTPLKGKLSYVDTDAATASTACCIRLDAGSRKSKQRVRESEKVSAHEQGPVYQHAGRLVERRGAADESTVLGFGIEGMGTVRARGKNGYAVTMPGTATPVIVRQCTTNEGVRFNLYRNASAKKPYAGYYYYLGYDTEPDCP